MKGRKIMRDSNTLVEKVLSGSNARQNIRLHEKYTKLVEKATGKQLNFEKKLALTTILENARKIQEATNTANIPSKTFFMDMVTAVVPNLITPDIVSTQAMEAKFGQVSYLRFSYGTDKGATKAGTMFNNSLYTGVSDPYYTSREIMDEAVENGVNFQFLPILPGTVTVTIPDGTVYTDDSTGNLIDPANPGTSVGTINYATGAFTCATATAGSTCNYQYNNEQVPDLMVPEINMSLAQIPLLAQSRKLAAFWGFDAAFDLKQQYGVDILELMSSQAAGEIAHEIDTEVALKLVKQAAAGPELTWCMTPPHGVNVLDHYDSFMVKLNQGAKQMFQVTQRVEPNFIICGSNVAAVLTSMRNFDASGSSDAVGPHFIGTLNGKYKCYVVPRIDMNTFVLGYKGSNFLEAGFVYAPYMPVATTDVLMPADFRGQQGYATSYATRMVNGKMYLRGRIYE